MSDSVTITGPSLALVAPLDLTEACLATPAFRAIAGACPELSVVVVCPESAAAFWSLHFSELLTYEETASPQKLAAHFAESSFQSALLLEDSRAAKALARLGVPQRLGREGPELAKLITEPLTIISQIGPPRHRVTRYLDLADKLGCDPNQPSNFKCPERPAPPAKARVALVADSDFGPAAQWSVGRFQELAKRLAGNDLAESSLLSLPGKSPATDALAALLDNLSPSRTQPRDLSDLLDALATCSVVVSGNGTLLHLAAHLGVPTVALLGPHSPLTDRPLGRIHEVLTTYAECSPCKLSKCPLDHRCLEDLSSERVAEAVESLLKANQK